MKIAQTTLILGNVGPKVPTISHLPTFNTLCRSYFENRKRLHTPHESRRCPLRSLLPRSAT